MSTRITRLAGRRWCWSATAALIVVMTLGAAAWAKSPELDLRGDERAGYITLSWTPDEDPEGAPPEYELQAARDSAFSNPKVVYRGAHTSTVLSGLLDGERWYRVRRMSGRQPGGWSAPKPFAVQHHPLSLAGGLFAVGAFVFAITAGFILKAGRDV